MAGRASLLACLLLLAAAACGGGTSAPAVQAPAAAVQGEAPSGLPEGLDTRVSRVIDGDTIVVATGHHIRLIGIDTPETKDPRKPVQCFGREASSFLTNLLPRGTPVRLVGDAEQTDQYDRTLAYVYRLPDGLFVNAELVRQGYAHVLTIPPNVAHADEFAALAHGASAAGKGLWSACPA